MTGRRDRIVAWLNDASARETGLVPILKNHASDAAHHPDLAARIERHVEETRRHADLMMGCLDRPGERPPTAKAALGGMPGVMQARGTGMCDGELVRHAPAGYAAAHGEIAAYRALAAGAREIGEEEIARTCDARRRDEASMAQFLEAHVPGIASATLQEPA